jgi:hypothetical protein
MSAKRPPVRLTRQFVIELGYEVGARSHAEAMAKFRKALAKNPSQMSAFVYEEGDEGGREFWIDPVTDKKVNA